MAGLSRVGSGKGLGKPAGFLVSVPGIELPENISIDKLDPAEYWIAASHPRVRIYRHWWIARHRGTGVAKAVYKLAERYPYGLPANELPEELSGEVMRTFTESILAR
jgi:hypothetical protein